MSEASSQTGAAGPCRPWGPAASLAWIFGAVVAWLGFQIIGGDFLVDWMFADASPGDVAQLATHAPFVVTVTLSAAIVPLAIIALAVRLRKCTLTEYLGLHMPDRRYIVIGLAALLILIPAVDLLSWLAGYAVTPAFVTDIYRSARDTNVVVLLALALVVAAPVVEETTFRGFLLPSLAQSRLGPVGAILLSSVAWAVLHVQYQPFYLIQIIILGALFGWLRLKSGSTTLTIVLHGLLNLVALTQAGIAVEWAV